MIHLTLYAVDVQSVDGVYRATWQAWAESTDDAIDQAFDRLCADIFPDRQRADWLFETSILIENLCHPLFHGLLTPSLSASHGRGHCQPA